MCVHEGVCPEGLELDEQARVCVCVVLTCVGQAEGPQPQVGGGVGDAAQAVLYGVDGLVHEYIGSIKLLQGGGGGERKGENMGK